jgi:hypothetical protein
MAIRMASIRSEVIRPIDRLRRLIVAGVLGFSIVTTAVLAVFQTFETSRECKGSFSSGFSLGFDVYRCALRVRVLPDGPKFDVPLPAGTF